jgi:non-ribosomal peptide synthetase-like protein
MVPSYLEQLAAIPLTTSDKVDRRALPRPTTRCLAELSAHEPPVTATERRLAEVLCATLHLDRASATADLFDELGGTSLTMARFAARVRTQTDLPTLSLREIYRQRTLRGLATWLDGLDRTPAPAAPVATARRPGTAAYAACGAAQLVVMLAMVGVASVVLEQSLRWIAGGVAVTDVVARGFGLSVGLFIALCLLPILVKWVLVGRWKPGEIRLWGPAYLRFWIVRWFIRTSPWVLFVGSPPYSWYLRALGARIGRSVVIFSGAVPVATDLLTIGAGTLVRFDVSFTGYRAVGDVLQIGPVELGRDVIVGERTVLDVDTRMGDGAQLGHASSLHPGQAVPAGERWHGCPAEPGGADQRIDGARCGVPRRIAYSLLQLALLIGLATVAGSAVVLVVRYVPVLPTLLGSGELMLTAPLPSLIVGIVAVVVFMGGIMIALTVMVTIPRLANRLLRPRRTYPLYGLRHICLGLVGALTNSRPFVLLLGDSSFIVGYLRALGYDLRPVEQTGSNFGTEMRHHTPFLTRVGTGTMVSDGLTVLNASFSATSFRVAPVVLGERNFVGNNVVVPPDARIGDNCLLATKVLVPTEGPVRSNVGLLGSPPFEIPRSTRRERALERLGDGQRRRLLRAKNRHNAATITVVLLVRAVQAWVSLLVVALGVDFYARFGTVVIPATLVALALLFLLSAPLLERAATGFRGLRPRECSIYDRSFWRHERLWKFYATPPLAGTPFQPLLNRLAGVRVGRRVFDDGCTLPEKSLVTIGDDATLNSASVVQCHSLEDGLFISDRTVVGDRCTIGIGGFVHYGVTMADGSELGSDSFLMKGEQTAPGSRWVGNPAVPAGGVDEVAR